MRLSFFQGDAVGYCMGKANNFVFVTAGKNDGPSTQGSKSTYCIAPTSQCTTVPPDLSGFSSFGQNLVESRWYPACITSQVFLFIGGGTDGTQPSNTVERAICCR